MRNDAFSDYQCIVSYKKLLGIFHNCFFLLNLNCLIRLFFMLQGYFGPVRETVPTARYQEETPYQDNHEKPQPHLERNTKVSRLANFLQRYLFSNSKTK